MSVCVVCGGCGAGFNVDEKFLGRTAKCGKCGARIPIQASPAIAPPPNPSERLEVSSQASQPDESREDEQPKTIARKPRPASEKQKAYAHDLGIEFDESITSRDISRLIDAAVAREDAIDLGEIEARLKTLRNAKPSEMAKELFRQGKSAFLVSWLPEEEGENCSISFTDNVTQDDAFRAMVTILFRIAEQREIDLFSLIMQYIESYKNLLEKKVETGRLHM